MLKAGAENRDEQREQRAAYACAGESGTASLRISTPTARTMVRASTHSTDEAANEASIVLLRVHDIHLGLHLPEYG